MKPNVTNKKMLTKLVDMEDIEEALKNEEISQRNFFLLFGVEYKAGFDTESVMPNIFMIQELIKKVIHISVTYVLADQRS